jgi:hypothetical protein
MVLCMCEVGRWYKWEVEWRLRASVADQRDPRGYGCTMSYALRDTPGMGKYAYHMND